MKQLKDSSNNIDNEVFNCMINNLFDEFRFFHKYPNPELKLTGKLYG